MMENYNELTTAIDAAIARYGNQDIDAAPALAREVQPLLSHAVQTYGAESEQTRHCATIVAASLLQMAVNSANSASAALVNSIRSNHNDTDRAKAAALNRLQSVRNVIEYINRLPVDEQFKAQRLNPQIEALNRLTDRISAISGTHNKRNPALIQSCTHTISKPTKGDLGAPHKTKRNLTVRQLSMWATAIVAAICIGAYLVCIYNQKSVLDDIRGNTTEESLMDYMLNYGKGHFADDALGLYLHLMDSVIDDPAQAEQPQLYPPLVRMDNFAHNPGLDPYFSSAIDRHVKSLSDSLYSMASKINTLQAWDTFQDLTPSRYYRDSSTHLDSLDRLAWGSESSAWQAADAAGNRQSYDRYLEAYPDGEHAPDADARLIDIEVKAYKNRGRASIENIDSICTISGRQANVQIFNDTGYDMEFLFSGPTSKRMSIGAFGVNSVKFDSGEYRVLVLIDNAHGDRFSFSQRFYPALYSTVISVNSNPSQ